MRLDLGFLALLPAFGLLLVGLKIGPYPGDERDPLAVGEPAQAQRTARDRREPPRFAAVRCDQVDLRLLVVLALGCERDPSAIRRPARLAVLVAGGQPARPCAVGREKPELGAPLVLVHVIRSDRGTGGASIGRERRRADTFDRPQIFDTQGALASRHELGSGKDIVVATAGAPAREARNCTLARGESRVAMR